MGSIPSSGRFPSGMAWLPTPVFFPGESHGQRSMAGYSPWGPKESDMTEQLHAHSTSSNSLEFIKERKEALAVFGILLFIQSSIAARF